MELANKLIADYRKAAKLSQTELAILLTSNGFPTTNKMISAWEKGVSVPNANQYLAICEVLKVGHHFDVADLTTEGLLKVQDYIGLLSMIPKYNNRSHYVPLYEQVVSAGSGNYVSDENAEQIKAPEGVDYGVRVSGDSMYPRYKDGDIVWVQKTTGLRVGDIGVFCVNGEAYIKMLGDNELVSINKKYAPIKIAECDNFYIQGKVVN